MAKSRMMNKGLLSKDKFLQLSCATQLLYFHMCLNADDEGFIDNAFTLVRQLPVGLEDLKILIEKEYIIMLEDYLYVVTHWRVHNNIDKQHYTGTAYIDYMHHLYINESKAYSLNAEDGINLLEYQIERAYLVRENSQLVVYSASSLKNNRNARIPQNESNQNSDCALPEPNLSSDCAQKELRMNSECVQNATQISKAKPSKAKPSEAKSSEAKSSEAKSSEAKSSEANLAIRDFLTSHNLTTIDERYEHKLTNFFSKNNKDVNDCSAYCEYVYNYISSNYETVSSKLFYTLSFKDDVLTKFYQANPKITGKVVPITEKWPVICPVCNNFHNASGYSEDCALNMNDMDSAEAIENAKRFNNMTEADKIKEINSFFKAAFSNKKF